MLFNSFEFLLFFIIFFFVYWVTLGKSLSSQNLLLLVASYIFYGWWDWRFLLLLLVSSGTDYLVGLGLGKTDRLALRRSILGVSIAVNLSILFVFKYFDFFVLSFIDSFSFIGLNLNLPTLNIILPLGISFYTLQTMSYSIDVYRRKILPTRNALTFFNFVSFFPQLVAGPIERAGHLIPQLSRPRTFSFELAQDGLRLILWGLFMKVVIADSLGPVVNEIFSNYQQLSGIVLLMGCAYFAVQVYCDFAGYSYIAVGLAKLMGIQLTINFRYPLLQPNISKLWRSWHISLISWLRDYLYKPLMDIQKNRWKSTSSILIVFVVSGLWHGAAWSFVIWGLIQGIYMSLSALYTRKRRRKAGPNTLLRQLSGAAFTFFIFFITAPLFRGEPLSQTLDYYLRILSPSLLSIPEAHVRVGGWVVLLLTWEWFKKDKDHPLVFDRANVFVRWFIYYLLGTLILRNLHSTQAYVYFQF